MSDQEFVVHQSPAWRDRADFIVRVRLPAADAPFKFEQMWARQLEESLFEICCIPFVVYDMALGDIVEASPSDHYTVLRTTRHSGRYTFRAYFGDTDHPAQAIYEQLTEAGALLEWSSPSLLAIDSADAAHAIFIAEFLGERASHGQLVYEKGFSEPLT